MSENATEAAPEATEVPAQEQPNTDQAENETDWKAEARKWEQRAKENGTKAREYDQQRKAAMTEAERAVVEAEERGRTAAVTDFGKRLATAEIKAEAASVGADLAGVFDYLDLTRFVDDKGEPDTKAIKSFVAGLASKEADRKKTGAHVSREGATVTPESNEERRFVRDFFA